MSPPTVRLGNLLEERDTRNCTDEMVLSVYRDHGVVPKASRSDNFNKTPQDVSTYKLVLPSDVVVNKMKAWQGSVAVSRHRGIVSGDYLVSEVTRTDLVDAGYLHYALRSAPVISEIRRLSTGIRPSQWRIYWDDFRNIEIVLPSVEMQQRTAALLNAETERIDQLIATKTRMVEALEERLRSSTLDDIARCGQLVPLKRVAEVIDCKHRTPVYADEGVPVVSPGDVTAGQIDVNRCHRFVDEIDYQDLSEGGRVLQPGDIVYSRNASVGLAGLVTGATPRFCLGQDVCVVRPADHRERSGRFLMHVLNTSGLRQIEEIKIGSTFSRINVEQVAQLRVPAVTTSTADGLVEVWDRRDRKVTDTVKTLRTQLALLRERRRSLITAAVTGQMEEP